jgi:Fe-S oxidoreductase
VIDGGWRDERVREALDLCLACKGCKAECPVNVDMATYKAEFLAHYYEHRLRPRSAYAFGLIHRWARVAAIAPRLVNALTGVPLAAPIARWAAGMAPERRIPQFAAEPFRRWIRRRKTRLKPRPTSSPSRRVVLWPDTFNNYFHPETARAAVGVLEQAGFIVDVPTRAVCCGRPLYDYGMLDTAKALLRNVMATLEPELRAGTPIVVLEPSCAAVFRDELRGLFPLDREAERLRSQTVLLSELLADHAGWRPPQLGRRAILHGHCHQKSVLGMAAEESALARSGVTFDALDSGCCGMAGAFGFEREHYAISQTIGERVLLPAVRAAAADTLIIANGFSCREQIAQATGREALHLADVLAMDLGDEAGPTGTAAD